MNKFLLIIFFSVTLLFTKGIIAQEIELDSIFLQESKRYRGVSPLLNYLILEKPSIELQKELLKRCVVYKFSTSNIIRGRVASLLESLAAGSESLEIRQEAFYHNVDMYYIGGGATRGFPLELFTDKVNSRIIEIIDRGITDTEINLNLEGRLTDIKSDKNRFSSIVKTYPAEKQQMIADSLMADYLGSIKHAQRDTSNLKYLNTAPLQLIYIVGWQYLNESASLLESKLQDARYKETEYQNAIILALGRMRYANYYEKALSLGSGNFRYLNSKEAFYKYIEVCNSIEIIEYAPFGDGNVFSTKLSLCLDRLSGSIKMSSIPEELLLEIPWAEKKKDIPELIEKTLALYNWIMHNEITIRDLEGISF